MAIEHFFTNMDMGENLEDQRVFYELDRLLQGKPEVVSGSTIIAQAEPPAWEAASDLAEQLLMQSKDLRIAVGLVRCWIAREGLPGLVNGFMLLARLVRESWDGLYPVPDDDEPDNYMDRINALAALNSYEDTICYFRNIKLLKNTKELVLTPRMFCIASGRLKFADKSDKPEWSTEQLRQALAESNASDVEAVRSSIVSVQHSISQIKTIFQDRAYGDKPDLGSLEGDLTVLLSFFELPTPAAEVVVQPMEGGTLKLEQQSAGVLGLIQCRADVVKMLERLCVFMEENEPAHPAPLFMRRAQRLLTMSFMEIVQDLTPDAVDAVIHFKGRNMNQAEE